jgi:hypothetical protein
MPRLDYSGGASCPALLLEPQRTNVLPQSEYYGGSGWDASAYPVTITSNSIISPDGNSNATLITPTSGNSRHAIREVSISAVSGATYTLSVFFKKGGSRYVVFGDGGDTLWRLVTADLDNGVITDESNASGTITPFANGWYRITCQITRGNSGLIYFLIGASETDSNSTLPSFNNTSLTTYSWGAQVESNASYPTSYIPTYGSSVTRSLDSCLATSVSDVIGQTQGTMFIDLTIDNLSSQTNNPIPLTLKGSGSTSSYIQVYTSGRVQAVHYGFGSLQANINLPSYGLTDGRHKFAFVYNGNDFRFYIDGALAGSDTSGLVDSQSEIHLGYYNTSFNGTTNNHQAVLFPTALTDSECIALTTL